MVRDVLSVADISRIIEMAWEDRTPFEAIALSYGLSEPQVIQLMRAELQRSAFKSWRQRVTGRATKHRAKRPREILRAYCPSQYKHR